MNKGAADTAEVTARAEGLARQLGDDAGFAETIRPCQTEYRELLRAVAALEPRFAFDRDGRPAAIDAVREALPLMERELFDAIVEDHACEVAAVEEALYRLALAMRRSPGSGGSSIPSTTDTTSAPTKIHNAS